MFEENVQTMPRASYAYVFYMSAHFGSTVVQGCSAAGIEARLP